MQEKIEDTWKIGLSAAIIPMLTMHATFLLSGAEGFYDWCIPYWSDCVSVSKTGRDGMAYYVFKIGMLTGAVLLAITWQRLSRILITDTKTERQVATMAIIASLALAAYTVALGHHGDAFRLVRRFGVVSYLALTFIVQVRLAGHMANHTATQKAGKISLGISASILSIAVFSLILDFMMGENYSRIENAFEWWLINLLIIHLIYILYALQRKTRNNLSYEARKSKT